jgi:hypothetical protein
MQHSVSTRTSSPASSARAANIQASLDRRSVDMTTSLHARWRPFPYKMKAIKVFGTRPNGSGNHEG